MLSTLHKNTLESLKMDLKKPFVDPKTFDKSPAHRFKGGGFLKLYTLSGFGKPRLDADDFEKSYNFIRYVQKRDLKIQKRKHP